MFGGPLLLHRGPHSRVVKARMNTQSQRKDTRQSRKFHLVVGRITLYSQLEPKVIVTTYGQTRKGAELRQSHMCQAWQEKVLDRSHFSQEPTGIEWLWLRLSYIGPGAIAASTAWEVLGLATVKSPKSGLYPLHAGH